MIPLQYADLLVWGTVAKIFFALRQWDAFQQAASVAGLKDSLALGTVRPRANEHPRKLSSNAFTRSRGRWNGR
jgi:hypothetical protein